MSIHIGKIIKEYCDEHHVSAYTLSQRLHMSYSNIYKMFNRSDISAARLHLVSLCLNTNFFKYYFTELDDASLRSEYNSLSSKYNTLASKFNTLHSSNASATSELEKLKTKFQLLEQENSFLKEMVQILKKSA